MKIKEKIAMIWAAPLTFVLVLVFLMVVSAVYLLLGFFNLSGTSGAIIYILDKFKIGIDGIRWRNLVKKDAKIHKFETGKLKKDEDPASNID